MTELIQVQAGNDAHLLVHVALFMQIFAKAGADVGEAAQPFNFLRLQFAFTLHDAHVDLQSVLVCQQFFHAVVALEEGNQD